MVFPVTYFEESSRNLEMVLEIDILVFVAQLESLEVMPPLA